MTPIIFYQPIALAFYQWVAKSRLLSSKMKKPSKARKDFLARPKSQKEIVAKITEENRAYFAEKDGDEPTVNKSSCLSESEEKLLAQYAAAKGVSIQSQTRENEASYTCPHCKGAMAFAPEHRS